MKLEKIIYATDFSERCQPALHYATAFAAAENARLLIVHVDDETPGLVIGDVGYGYLPHVDRIAEEQLEQLEKIKPSTPNVSFERHFLRGDAAEEIIKFAKEQDAHLIVIGTHGASGLSRLLMGGVAEEIVRSAPCPVLTVRIPDPPSTEAEASQESVAKL